ncbi:hypothetical protein V494_02650 [Pseudogymnoascus sp. VKM F-4513 (FW-928)]|nr:hypothetical protein V494_02650 [Pseudogymnoascus sp. VKM F-4513 (FW-928)]
MPHLPHTLLSPIHPPRTPHLLSSPPTQTPLNPHHSAANLIPNRGLLLLNHNRAMAEPKARAARWLYDDSLSAVTVHCAMAGGGGTVSETAVSDAAVADAAVCYGAVRAWGGDGALFAAEAGGACGAGGAGAAGEDGAAGSDGGGGVVCHFG